MPLGVGLISGTSADGIDAALVEISDSRGKTRLAVRAFATYPYPRLIRKRIMKVSDPKKGTTGEVCLLNFEIGELFADAVKKICRKANVSLRKLDFIGSHGQTISHFGKKGTLQIGEPSIIAERTGVTTVADFRPRDIAAGGEGAPLAPYLHYLLFSDSKKDRAVHNIGGISNLTFLPKGGRIGKVLGFDTGPGNMVIDGLVEIISKGKRDLDQEGRAASRGFVSLRLLRDLLRHPFINQKPPKSAGREEFGRDFIKDLYEKGKRLRLREEDLIATATAFTAASIAENYRRFVFPRAIPDEVIFCGGGIHNKTLMRMIRMEMRGIKISTCEDHRVKIPSDAVEAVLFAVLGFKALKGKSTNVPSVTGAGRAVVLGKIVP
ncbi:MAG: anhydro-N-acetylmuramic acid kinase [Deltaproteobacteria bacterium]|nr:anhydro-N-acetylmuramic acid kinase [Deltaproteobacteria bacterium]MBI4374058.1 anhydro-N-acetylmuramic acid kinase [Deltaproteobacteria bacterium]